MVCPPFVLRWIDGFCYWVLLSKNGRMIVNQSTVGFDNEADAKADLLKWNKVLLI